MLRFVMVGGFLGAGKTTTMARLAQHYISLGKRVGIVTNDQAQDLVDTSNLRAQGLAVEEVAGACFCCNFNGLLGKVESLQRKERPDVLLAEPVGSCTDLVATVIQPLMDLYADGFEVAPYAVLFKPSHGLRILGEESDGGFSPKAAYIFRKQLEEADSIVLNGIDTLSEAEVSFIQTLVKREYPQTPILAMSAKTGDGFQDLIEFLESKGNFGKKILDIDYDVYAEGEAEMGWHNSHYRIVADSPIGLDPFVTQLVDSLRLELAHLGEVGHLKVIAQSADTFAVANLVSSRSKAELSLASRGESRELSLTVNARVSLDPEVLEQIVNDVVAKTCKSRGAEVSLISRRSLRPGRPTPTHRYAVAKK